MTERKGTAMNGVKKRTIEILDGLRENDRTSNAVNLFIIVLIFLNVMAMMLESVRDLRAAYGDLFSGFEVFSIFVFSGEYALRMWSCTAREGFERPLAGRFRYGLRAYPLVDILTILPFFIPFIIPLDLRFIRIFRFMRIFRVFKLDRYVGSLRTIGRVLQGKKDEIFSLSASMFIVVMLSSFFMYLVESEAQPEMFSSIPMTVWWAVSTLTTVGYGDMYPVTLLGRVLGCIIAVLGIGMFALPTSILGAGFLEEMHRARAAKKLVCPHCGKEIPRHPDEHHE